MSERAARSVFGEIKAVRAQAVEGPAPQTETTVYIGADEPVFNGHYPGFPILPGVCLVECAHRSALLTMPATGVRGASRLATVESARFLDPVYPDETVSFELTWKPVDSGWQCRVVARSPRGESARICLRYTAKDA